AMKIRAGSDDHAGFDRLVDEAYKTHYNDAKVLSKMGQLFQNNNQQEFAERYLKRAIELEPKDTQLLCLYCNTLFGLRKYRELLAATAPLKAEPKTRALASLLDGAAWIRMNRADKAVALLAEAYAAAPGQAEVADAFFDALVATGQRAKAEI